MRIALVIALALAAMASPAARAQLTADYPSGLVRLLVPFAAGGPTDVVARILAEQLSARWGGRPAPIVDKLSADIRAVVASPAFLDRVKNLGINAYGNTPAELTSWMRSEIARWQQVAKAANLKAD